MDLHTYSECLRAGSDTEFPVVLDNALAKALGWTANNDQVLLSPLGGQALMYTQRAMDEFDLNGSCAVDENGQVLKYGNLVGNISQITLLPQEQAAA
jgi:hypothetical protein